MLAIERTHEFRGLYHVLHGAISPMDGIGPDDLKIDALLRRIRESAAADQPVQELILATNPKVEGDATAMYIARLVGPLKRTRDPAGPRPARRRRPGVRRRGHADPRHPGPPGVLAAAPAEADGGPTMSQGPAGIDPRDRSPIGLLRTARLIWRLLQDARVPAGSSSSYRPRWSTCSSRWTFCPTFWWDPASSTTSGSFSWGCGSFWSWCQRGSSASTPGRMPGRTPAQTARGRPWT